MQNRSRSRRHTPWDGEKDVTATQEFLRTHYHARYEERHPALQDAGETALINAHRPACCPYCGSGNYSAKDMTRLAYSDTNVLVVENSSLPQGQYSIPEKSPFPNG